MKIIDLLNKIANGEEVPKKIKYDGQEWKYNPINDYEGIKYGGCLLNRVTLDGLNDEVEIIEEDKEIEKLILDDLIDTDEAIYDNFHNIELKINELIDKVNSLENKQ